MSGSSNGKVPQRGPARARGPEQPGGRRAGLTPRAAATRVLVQVLDRGRSLASALPEGLSGIPVASDRALVQALCYGVLRWYPRLEAIAQVLLTRPMRARDRDVQCLILTGLYQLAHMRVPPHAAVSETVAVAGELGKTWASGVVNAVLRRFQREAAAVAARVDRDPALAAAHPAWLLAAIQARWPQHWSEIVAANNAHPPMTLRVNAARISRAQYLACLTEAGIDASATPRAAYGIELAEPTDVERLPGFMRGLVSVQDAAAQLAAELLALQPGQRVLDACAAPGGKTAHILETLAAHGDGAPAVTAVDIDADRLAQVQDDLSRLGLRAQLACGDAGNPKPWWNGRGYDRILLDAPCSATGVIRRHPDIKVLRRAADIGALARRQQHLLAGVWPLLKPGGMLLYATCSILGEENEAVIGMFLESTPDAQAGVIDANWGRPFGPGRQIAPGEAGMDGFYYARLEKA